MKSEKSSSYPLDQWPSPPASWSGRPYNAADSRHFCCLGAHFRGGSVLLPVGQTCEDRSFTLTPA